ncbi:MAG: hypothetical protein AAGI28_12940 [Pseudomonadota bacterium]
MRQPFIFLLSALIGLSISGIVAAQSPPSDTAATTSDMPPVEIPSPPSAFQDCVPPPSETATSAEQMNSAPQDDVELAYEAMRKEKQARGLPPCSTN